MVSVAIGDELRFAENRLTLAVRDAGEEIGFGIPDEFDHGAPIGVESGDAAILGSAVGQNGNGQPRPKIDWQL